MESVDCNLCQSETATHWLTGVDRVMGHTFDICRCCHCRLRYTNPRPAVDEMTAYYPEPAALPWPAQIVKRWLRQWRARWCATGLPPGRVLDIGCGDGWMLNTLHQAGWDVTGTERCEQRAAPARNLGVDVRIGDVARCDFPAASFDLVILWHSLEHLHDPLGTLVEVRRLMRPLGRLVVAVPNAESWQAQVAGHHWVHLDVPRHLYHFDSTTLELMLRRAGFQVQRWSWSSPAYEHRGWWAWLLTHLTADAVVWTLAGLVATLITVPLSTLATLSHASAALALQAIPASKNA